MGALAIGLGATSAGAAWPPVRQPRRTATARRTSQRFGDEAERAVAMFLHSGGYTILSRRLRQRSGELDLVVVRDDTVAFVEVKARTRGWDGLESVNVTKQRRLSRGRDEWLSNNPDFSNLNHRFDIALVWPGGRIEYLENAFEGVEATDFVF